MLPNKDVQGRTSIPRDDDAADWGRWALPAAVPDPLQTEPQRFQGL